MINPASYASYSQTEDGIDLLKSVLLNESTNLDFGGRQKALIDSYPMQSYDDLIGLLETP